MTYISFLSEYGDRFIDGMLVTGLQFLCSLALATALALTSGLMLLSSNPAVKGAAVIYVEFFRGTSLLVQLFWLFFVLPLFGITLEPFLTGFLAVGLNTGAYGAQLVEGAIKSVPRGQWEAAYALSMSPAKRMRRIIIPQALAIMLPAWGNLVIELLKSTALVALIAVPDLMFEAKQLNSSTYLSTWTFGTALVIYYIFARFLITPTMRSLERVMARRMGRS
ncbi:ectoine/hydroxyectoine ABC transporter permease subunit EhuC [Mesorhizobium sp. M1A.F.Ca.IN.022.05.2.1]|uniref:ectoine/hydroxyectoine ABC transporter permease subunit EhuC n=1 Tax=unclassified Mesorhizobium TaxID=325217 RepID=UPI000FCB1B6C|nr:MULTISPECIES: ectoine/hydroxyectoine ABC transporter permease subunit EhuC [unclassified Mesorhizobium]RUV83715.1 ectoine/hydroxyectoine ABC transporter permease subunit EhuC [Mesorhizobium sp. M1A.F.Ca.IN.020.32.1.1]RUW04186.1 ectoine/hydroxyectoine ABC transporter permease subunit EhuC [Mesorhizobium sp. M1A.F.Ca.IN.022.05.2.1]RWF84984.1 MAG: ectoine/hydroxyectoine ABC transporter permease subunit EhuC [Mesorhizobium sp.]RWG07037.1 MAG: ectoine/hydroxyectoine ABC transporter permease subun